MSDGGRMVTINEKVLDQIEFREYFCFKSDLSLEQFCERFSSAFRLPKFYFDSENETESAWIVDNNIVYGIARAFEPETLHKQDSDIPEGYNYTIFFGFLKGHFAEKNRDSAIKVVILPYAQKVADKFNTDINYYRSWHKSKGNSPISPIRTFKPVPKK